MQISHTQKKLRDQSGQTFFKFLLRLALFLTPHMSGYFTEPIWDYEGYQGAVRNVEIWKKRRQRKNKKRNFQCRRESWRTIFKGMGEIQSVLFSHVRVPYRNNKRHWGSQRSRPNLLKVNSFAQPNFLTDNFVQRKGPKMP